MASKIVEFTLNGRAIEVMVRPLTTVQSLLREQLGHTATRSGCRQGGCGSCTVLVDGAPMPACLLPVEDVAGRSVITLEGLGDGLTLHPLQAAFHERFAVQCGYCTAGVILLSKALLDRQPHPTRGQIAEALAGNLCRCTGYEPIIQAVQAAAATMAGQQNGHHGGASHD